MIAVRAFLAVAIALLTPACSVHISDTGGHPTDDIDWDRVIARAKAAGAYESGQLIARSESVRIPAGDPIQQQLMASFAEVAEARRHLTLRAEHPFFFDEGRLLPEVRGKLAGEAPSLVAIGVDEPIALTYPDNHIIVSRRLVDGLWSNDPVMAAWGLKAVASHELAHQQDGHAIFNWLAVTGQRLESRRSLLSGLSRITSIIPIASLRYDHSPGSGFTALKGQPALFEFLADYWAFYTLNELGAPQGTLSDTLERIERASRPVPERGKGLQVGRLIGPRWRCMTLLESDPGIAAGLTSLRVGSVRSITGGEPVPTPPGPESEAWQLFVAQASTEQATSDDLYWSCAFWSLAAAGPANDAQLTGLFGATARADFPSAFVRFATGEHPNQPAGQSLFATVLDGIPLFEAGTAYLRPRVDERPQLELDDPEYRGWKDGSHAIRLRIRNRGLSATPAPVRFEALHGGALLGTRTCGDNQFGDAPDLCRPVNRDRPFASYDSATVTVFAEGPRDADFVRTPLTIIASACPTDVADCGDSAERLSARTDVELDLRPYLAFFMMSYGGEPGPAGVPPFVTVGLDNDGFTRTTKPVYLHAFNDGVRVEISSCPTGEAGATCTPYVLPAPLDPGQQVSLPVWLVNSEDGRHGNALFRFVVSNCATLERDDVAVSAGNNCGGELRVGRGNYYGRQ